MKKLSPLEQKASSKVLDELRKHAQGMMSSKMDGLKKVTVASNKPEGLEKGLDMAKKIIGQSKNGSDLTESPTGEEFGVSKKQKLDGAHPEIESVEGSDAEEASESPEYEASEDESMEMNDPKTPSEIDKLIDELMAKKASMMHK